MEDTKNEVIDSTNNEEVVATEATDTDTDTEAEVELTLEEDTPEVDVNKLQELNKKLFARAKKAEEALKKVSTKEVKPKTDVINKNEQYLTREEAILIAKGYEDSELAKLKAIAKGTGCSLLDATKDEMFVSWKTKQEEENKKTKSKLGASKGSGSVRAEKSVSDMTEEEHREYVRKMFNN